MRKRFKNLIQEMTAEAALEASLFLAERARFAVSLSQGAVTNLGQASL